MKGKAPLHVALAITVVLLGAQLLNRHPVVSESMAAFLAEIVDLQLESMCNPGSRLFKVFDYENSPPPPPAPSGQFVKSKRGATAVLKWLAADEMTGLHVQPGNVAGKFWCTGTLIADDAGRNLLLTAGHCLKKDPVVGKKQWITPKENNVPLEPEKLAPLMKVYFNYLEYTDRPGAPAPDIYPIKKLLEYGPELAGNRDFAVLEIEAPNGAGPRNKYDPAAYDASADGLALDKLNPLTIFQHPQGVPMRIGWGTADVQGNLLLYADLDTEGGSSGAGILSKNGKLVGVHVKGGCLGDGSGHNEGLPLTAISAVSNVIKSAP